MNPMLKRVLALVAVKKAVDAYQERRRPRKPPLASRLLPAVVTAVGGGLVYLAMTGKLQGVTDQIKQVTGASGQPRADVPPPSPAPPQDGPVGPPA